MIDYDSAITSFDQGVISGYIQVSILDGGRIDDDIYIHIGNGRAAVVVVAA